MFAVVLFLVTFLGSRNDAYGAVAGRYRGATNWVSEISVYVTSSAVLVFWFVSDAYLSGSCSRQPGLHRLPDDNRLAAVRWQVGSIFNKSLDEASSLLCDGR